MLQALLGEDVEVTDAPEAWEPPGALPQLAPLEVELDLPPGGGDAPLATPAPPPGGSARGAR